MTQLEYQEMLAAKQRALDSVLMEVAAFKFEIGAIDIGLDEIAVRYKRFASNMNTLQRDNADQVVRIGELQAQNNGLSNNIDKLSNTITEQRRELNSLRQTNSNLNAFVLRLTSVVEATRDLFKSVRFASMRDAVLPIQKMINSVLGAEQHEVV